MCTTACNAISSKRYPYKQSFKLNALSLALLGCFLHSSVEAVEFAEFYDGFLRGKTVKETVDISRFNYGNPIPAGEYLSDIYLNQEFKGRLKLQFIEVPEKDNTALCADDTLLEMLDLTDDAIARTRNEHNGCILFDNMRLKSKLILISTIYNLMLNRLKPLLSNVL